MFSLCSRIGRLKKRKCSWKKERVRTTMDETCDTPDDQTLLRHEDAIGNVGSSRSGSWLLARR